MSPAPAGLLAPLFGMVLLAGCGHNSPPPPPQAPDVSVSQPLERGVTEYVEFTGRTDAPYYVEVRARVKGYLVKVNFHDGQPVRKGEVLYEIDPRPYAASLGEAQGEKEKAEGQKQLADIQVERYARLVPKGAASAQDLDEWRGKQAAAAGSVAAAKAQVDSAKLNLDFCTISSPIDGQIGRTYYQIGNLVNPDTMTLTTIASIDPMYTYFSVDEPTLLRILKLMREGEIKTIRKGEMPVEMGLADDVERKFPLRGTVDFVNNQVDKQTATITVRGTFPNPYDLKAGKPPLLRPGMFTRVRVPLGPPRPRLLVNERAVGTDQGFKFVYVVDDQNRVQYRRVKLGPLEDDGLQVIQDGLKPGDWVVVNGLQRCRPRAEVRPEKVDMITLDPTEDGKGGRTPAAKNKR
jgi:multidrug efflux system membrane fusion protein